jgi:hypothetical protein
MPSSTHETVKTTQTTMPEGSGSNVGGIVVGVFVGLVVVGGVALYVVKQGNPLGNQQQSFQNPGNSGNTDGVVDGHDNPLQDNNNNNDDENNSGGASEPVPNVPNATESFNESSTYVSAVNIETELAENVYDSLDALGGLGDQAAKNLAETTISLDNDNNANDTGATGDLLF